MDKNGTLTIKDFQQGVADSPLLGFAKMNNIELFEKKGVARIQFGSELSFNTTSLPIAMVYDSLGNQYVGCIGGELYKNGTLLNTLSPICDLAVVTDGVIDPNGTYPIEYILITYMTDSIQFYGPTYSAGAAFVGGHTGFANGHYKKIVVGIDISTNNTPYIYITNGNKIAALSNFANASPGSAPTYSFNASALTLQPGYYAYTLNEIGKYLAIGTHGEPSGAYGVFSVGSTRTKKGSLVLWDRTSPTFNLPIYLKEGVLGQLLQLQNRLYMNVGNRGRIMITDTASVEQVKRLPFCFNRQFGTVSVAYPNAMTLHNGEIVVGVSTQGSSGDTNGNYGIYTINLNPAQIGNNTIPYPTNMRNTISTGYTGNSSNSPMQIGFLYSGLENGSQETLFIGWKSGSTYGVDKINYPVASNYTAIIESPYYTVGSELAKHTFKRMEISLTAPLITGQSIRISYREDLNDTDWTEIGEYTSTNFGTNNVYNCLANLASKVKLQFKIEMTQPTNTPFGNNIELESLSFYSSEK